MNRLAKYFLGPSLALVLTASSLGAQTALQFGSLPLWFEAGSPGKFIAHGAKSEFVVTPDGAEFTLVKAGGETASGSLRLVGASSEARISGDGQLGGKINYLLGCNPDQWQANVPTFARVRVEEVYPGVSVVYYGNRQKLEYDFNLAAGADPSVIALRFAGAKKISVNSQGELVIQFKTGSVVQHAPLAYQTVDGSRKEIAAGYKMLDKHTVAFALGNYDRSQPLVIDPVLTYSTYFGGNYGDTGWAIAVNPTDGSVYVAGQTFSTKITNSITLSTPGAFQTNYHGGKQAGDAFVARFDSTGSNLIYATYLGGSADDAAYAIAVDAAGNAFVAGATISSNFPVANPVPGGNKISGTYDKNVKNYPTDIFVTELNPGGSNLIYSTYLGGGRADAAYGLALDPMGNVFITGFTYSTNFPVTPGAFQPSFAFSNTVLNANAFVAEIAAGGSALKYSTYLGGTNYDVGRAIAVNNNRVFVTGYTYSTNFPNTNHLAGFDHLNGSTDKKNYGSDAFVAAFTSSVTNLTLLYSTYLGGSNYDAGNGIAAMADGTAYVTGYLTSTNYPYTTTNVPYLGAPYIYTNKNGYWRYTNSFLTQVKWDGTQAVLGYSAVFGGKGGDIANGVALDPAGNAYVIGSATSTNFPVTTDNISGYLSATNSSRKNKDYSDAFIIAFNTNASALLYSAYLGGREQDYGNAIAVDPLGNAYITGQTLSTNFPAVNARQTYRNGTNDMFLAKISLSNQPFVPSLTIAPLVPSSPPGIALKWQMFPADYAVEYTTNLESGNWLTVPDSPVYTNGWYQLNLPATNGSQMFRLHQQ